jgi:hypothetical protein
MVMAAGLAAGCLKVKDRMTLRPDGSGTVRIETEILMPAGAGRMGSADIGRATAYPPTSTMQAAVLFPAKDFTIVGKPTEMRPAKPTFIVEVAFKDIQALVTSPYGRAHSLWIAREGGSVVLKARTGVQLVAGIEVVIGNLPPELKADGGETQAKMITEAAQKLAAEFTIVMPGAAKVEQGAATVQGNTITWSVERAKFKEPAEAAKAFGEVLVARCPDAGVTFTPVSPVRLDLTPLKELADVKIADAAAVDVEKVRAAAKFVPVALQVTRSFDLVGDAFQGRNGASLSALVILPTEFKPEHWGQAKLTEITDDRGTDLLAKGRDDEDYDESDRYASGSSDDSDEGDEADAERPSAVKRADVVQSFRLALKVPPPTARKIDVLKGQVELQYAGPLHRVRLMNAIPNESIVEMKLETGMREPGDGMAIANPKLVELGVELKVAAARMSGMTMVQLQMGQRGGVLKDVQVYDGKEQPCSMMSAGGMMRGGDDAARYIIPGYPEGPLSLVVIVQSAGPVVTIPIELKDVPFAEGEAAKPPVKQPAKGALKETGTAAVNDGGGKP